MPTLPSACTGKETILDGQLWSLVLTDGRAIVLMGEGATIEATILVTQVYGRTTPVTFRTDRGIEIGRHSDAVVNALCDIAEEGPRNRSHGLAREWLRAFCLRGFRALAASQEPLPFPESLP